MSEIWDTKDGRRRVRRDPPTVDDAVLAAQGLTDDLEGQIDIVVSLMPVSAEEARRAILKMRRSRDDTRLTIGGRAVIHCGDSDARACSDTIGGSSAIRAGAIRVSNIVFRK